MIKLNLDRKPKWLDLGIGVRLLLAPMSTALMIAARSDDEVQNLPATATNDERGMTFAHALARRAVIDWEGVGDADGGGGVQCLAHVAHPAGRTDRKDGRMGIKDGQTGGGGRG